MNELLIGIDIGGTKCAVILGNRTPEVISRVEFPTEPGPEATILRLEEIVQEFLDTADGVVGAIGISCGGPLDSRRGVILSPPNLPGWDNVGIVDRFRSRFGLPTAIANDANACALAEWRWGAGRGCRNMIFLTFGTGLGAGLILDGRLYSGTNDMAGEAGHIRLKEDGPYGYGKAGSFEGFCSGGGIARHARQVLLSRSSEQLAAGSSPSTRDIALAAAAGDQLAVEILEYSGRHLGLGLSILIDILNPERIVIGSVFTRCREFLEPAAQEVIRREALAAAADVCTIAPAELGEQIGDFGSLSVALSCEFLSGE